MSLGMNHSKFLKSHLLLPGLDSKVLTVMGHHTYMYIHTNTQYSTKYNNTKIYTIHVL